MSGEIDVSKVDLMQLNSHLADKLHRYAKPGQRKPARVLNWQFVDSYAFLVAAFFAGAFLAVVFFAAVFLAGAFFAAALPRAGFFSLPGQSMFTQMRHGPRAVSTTTTGAPQCSHTSPVAESLPRAGSG